MPVVITDPHLELRPGALRWRKIGEMFAPAPPLDQCVSEAYSCGHVKEHDESIPLFRSWPHDSGFSAAGASGAADGKGERQGRHAG